MRAIWIFLFAGCASSLCASAMDPLPSLPNTKSSLQIIARTQPGQPWTVAGENGALFGRQNGKFEAWLWPVKVLSNFSIRAELFDYRRFNPAFNHCDGRLPEISGDQRWVRSHWPALVKAYRFLREHEEAN